MRTTRLLTTLFVVLTLATSYGQGTFVYDQQSSIEGVNGEFSFNIQSSQPFGQSFTPSLTAVDFIRLRLSDPPNGIGATLVVNLRQNSITGTIIAASSPFVVPDGFGQSSTPGFADFFFQTSVSVTPGTTYYFQPVIQSGNPVFCGAHNGFNYGGGSAFFNGEPSLLNIDLWFREGIVVPEPSAGVLILVGLAMTRFVRRSSK